MPAKEFQDSAAKDRWSHYRTTGQMGQCSASSSVNV